MDEASKKSPFNPYQTNHLMATFRHIDHLLSMIDVAVDGPPSEIFPHYNPDLSEQERKILREAAKMLRTKLAAVLVRNGLGKPEPRTKASHAVTSAFAFISIALDDLRPEEMRGYGAVSPEAVVELNSLILELQSFTTETRQALEAERKERAS